MLFFNRNNCLKTSYAARLGLAGMVALCLTPTSKAVVFDNGNVNVVNSASESIEVRNGASSTTLNVVANAAIGEDSNGFSVSLFDSSVLSMDGGELAGSLLVTDDAVASLSGGNVGDDVEVRGNGQLLLTGTGFISDDVRLFDNAHFEMTGGEVNDQFFADGFARVILAATAGPINDDLFIRENATLEMHGSVLGDELFVQGSAQATITSGRIVDDLNANDDATIVVERVHVEDSVDASGNGRIVFHAGLVEGSVSAVGNSMVTIWDGEFPNVFSDGEELLAVGGKILVHGGTFGTAGTDGGDGRIAAAQLGRVYVAGITVAGVADGTAPAAALEASLGGTVTATGIAFGDLNISAATGGTVIVDDVTAADVSITSLGGNAVFLGGAADSLNVKVDLGGAATIRAGQFDEARIDVAGGGIVRIAGSNFFVNNEPRELGVISKVAGDIRGKLEDGSDFFAFFSRNFASGATVELVPEPAASSVLLPLLAVLASIRRAHAPSECDRGTRAI